MNLQKKVTSHLQKTNALQDTFKELLELVSNQKDEIREYIKYLGNYLTEVKKEPLYIRQNPALDFFSAMKCRFEGFYFRKYKIYTTNRLQNEVKQYYEKILSLLDELYELLLK